MSHLLALLTSLGFMGWGGWVYRAERQRRQACDRARGRLLAIETSALRRGDDDPVVYQRGRYGFWAGGEHTVLGPLQDEQPPAELDVYYPPGQPAQAFIMGGLTTSAAIGAVAFGLLCLLTTVFTWLGPR